MVNASQPSAPQVLITDLDNTLWDWFAAWHASFEPMLNRLCEISGLPRETLEQEIRPIHQARGTSEYSNLVNELPSLVEFAKSRGVAKTAEMYDDAIHILRRERRRATQLYPGVKESLQTIQESGVVIVAYTESVAFWTEWRIKHTGLDGVISTLYSAPDHDLPAGTEIVRHKPHEEYGLERTKHRHVPRGNEKPNAAVLGSILKDMGCKPSEAIYVGDSLLKDVQMAQLAGVFDVWAKYGEVQRRPEYDLLRRVSHWTDDMVARERNLMDSPDIHPSVVLEHKFGEILPLFGIGVSE